VTVVILCTGLTIGLQMLVFARRRGLRED